MSSCIKTHDTFKKQQEEYDTDHACFVNSPTASTTGKTNDSATNSSCAPNWKKTSSVFQESNNSQNWQEAMDLASLMAQMDLVTTSPLHIRYGNDMKQGRADSLTYKI